MERLTKKESLQIFNEMIEKNKDYVCSNDELIYNKLGKLEDLEEKLGCPLDIIFDALYRGIVCTPHPFYTHEIIYPKKEYNIVQLFQFYYLKVDDGVVDIKDYGKTWWLRENESE